MTRRHRKLYKPSRLVGNNLCFFKEFYAFRRSRAKSRTANPSAYNGTSGSEEVYESIMESIESSNSLAFPHHNTGKMNKVSSADSLLTMIRNTASNKMSSSTPSSPQLSETGDALSSGYPTPLSTPDTPNGSFLSLQSGKPCAKEKTKQGSQIQVSVLNPLNPKKNQESFDNPERDEQSSIETPAITLEVPTFNFGKCLSPIKELPKETSQEINSAPAQESLKFVKGEKERRKYSSLESETCYQEKKLNRDAKLVSSQTKSFENEDKKEYQCTASHEKSAFLGGKKVVMKQEKIEELCSPTFLGFKEDETPIQRSRYQSIEIA